MQKTKFLGLCWTLPDLFRHISIDCCCYWSNLDLCCYFQPTGFTNLDHLAVYKKAWMAILAVASTICITSNIYFYSMNRGESILKQWCYTDLCTTVLSSIKCVDLEIWTTNQTILNFFIPKAFFAIATSSGNLCTLIDNFLNAFFFFSF